MVTLQRKRARRDGHVCAVVTQTPTEGARACVRMGRQPRRGTVQSCVAREEATGLPARLRLKDHVLLPVAPPPEDGTLLQHTHTRSPAANCHGSALCVADGPQQWPVWAWAERHGWTYFRLPGC